MVLFSPQALACWSLSEKSEIEGFAELNNRLVLSFRDAVDCAPVSNASVKLGELTYQTDARGNLELPMAPFASQMDARIPITVARRGYINLETEIVVAAGTVIKRRMVMSRELPPGKLRFVLTWEDEPTDLDLHLKGPDFHVSYRNMRHAPERARLDHDELNGYGPETITLERARAGAIYDIYVDNYSNDNDFTGLETVAVYSGKQRLHKIELDAGGHRAVHIMKLGGDKQSLINQPSPRP